MQKKRLLVCLLGGAISAAVCMLGATVRGVIGDIPAAVLAASILNRLMIGFVIAVSAWKIHYLLHGAVIGLLVTLITSLNFLQDNPTNFILYTLAGVIYGIFIEWLATRVFQSPKS